MIFIALRQLWARKRQTILTLLGVMLGAAAYIAISGILLGFRNYLLDQMVNNDAHVRISAKARLIEENSFDHVFTQPQEKLFWIVPPSGRKDADKIDNVQEWIQRLRADKDVEAYAPQLNLMVLYQKGKISRNGRIQGIVPSMQSRVALIEKNIVTGSLRDLSESGQNLLIGDGLRENLGLRKGDSVTVVNGHGDRFQFKISGAFQSGNKGVDESLSYVALTSAQNIVKCTNRAGLHCAAIVLEQLASADAVLTQDEKDLGVCIVDIGGGTTDIAVFSHGAIRHTAVIPIAGDQVTNDIAVALRTPTADAEEIKIRHGVAMHTLADASEMIEVPGVGDRPPRKLSRQALADVIEPRVSEIYELVQAELRRSGYEELLSSGIVLTGGSAVMQGMVELGEEVFHMPVRIGYPNYSGALAEVVCEPRYANAMGLVLEGAAQKRRGIQARQTRNVGQVFSRMRSWFERNF